MFLKLNGSDDLGDNLKNRSFFPGNGIKPYFDFLWIVRSL